MNVLPKRVSPYILTLLVIIMGILVLWLARALDSPEIQKAIQRNKEKQREMQEQGTAVPVVEKTSGSAR